MKKSVELKPGDAVAVAGRAEYVAALGVGRVKRIVTFTETRVVVEWPGHKRARTHKAQNLRVVGK
jgi:hypothetical protein